MATIEDVRGEGSGHARNTYRLRVSSKARVALSDEWARCRWIWNECVARSRKAHADGERIGPAALDKMPTVARGVTPWLREGSSVPQRQVIRDFGRSRAKALMDIKARLSPRRRAGMPKWRKRRGSAPSLNYTRRGFRIEEGRLHLAGGIVCTACGVSSPRDKNSARVMLIRAGLNPAGVEGTRPDRPPDSQAA